VTRKPQILHQFIVFKRLLLFYEKELAFYFLMVYVGRVFAQI